MRSAASPGPGRRPSCARPASTRSPYEAQLEARKQRGEGEETLRQRYGLGVFDLRETLQQALSP